MARRKSSVLDKLPDHLAELPWWLGPILAFFLFAALYWIVPACIPSQDAPDTKIPTAKAMRAIWIPILRSALAPGAACIMLLAWLFSLGKKLSNRRLLDRQQGLGTIRDLDWRAFERLLGEAFQRQGYDVEQVGGSKPDGGVDLRLFRDSKRAIVQCKHWRDRKVGVNVVRELLGVVSSERADEGVLVTAGDYSADAIDFANRNGIRLIDGSELERMIVDVQRSPRSVPSPRTAVSEQITPQLPRCPVCNSPMVRRVARKGPNPGSEFWGCSTYPTCKGTRQA